jgi:hypothetical protein
MTTSTLDVALDGHIQCKFSEAAGRPRLPGDRQETKKTALEQRMHAPKDSDTD